MSKPQVLIVDDEPDLLELVCLTLNRMQVETQTARDIAGAKRLYPDSLVDYQTADLLDLPAAWAGAFDLVVEAYTVQPLYGPVRQRALAALHGPVAPGGSLLVLSRATDEDHPVRDPAMMPWPLTPAELALAGGPLRAHRIEKYADDQDPPRLRWRAEFRRDG